MGKMSFDGVSQESESVAALLAAGFYYRQHRLGGIRGNSGDTRGNSGNSGDGNSGEFRGHTTK